MNIPITQSKDWQNFQDALGETSFLQQGKDFHYLAILPTNALMILFQEVKSRLLPAAQVYTLTGLSIIFNIPLKLLIPFTGVNLNKEL